MRHAIADTWTLSNRMLKHNVRSADTIMTIVGMPLMLLLAFVFVLGGAMNTGPIRYVDFVVPVLLLFCITCGSAYSAFRVNADIITGMFTRFRTMPIARSAVLGGHIVASVIVNAVSVILIGLIALLIGYRPTAGLTGWLVTVGLLLLALVDFSIIGVAFGIFAKTAEGSSMFMYLVMGLLFVSSGFAPSDTMAPALQAFADHQPMTPIINALRAAQLGLDDQGSTVIALGWLVGIGVAFAAFAAWAYQRAASRPSG